MALTYKQKLEILKEIRELEDRSVQSIKSYGDYLNDELKTRKLILDIEKNITKMEEEIRSGKSQNPALLQQEINANKQTLLILKEKVKHYKQIGTLIKASVNEGLSQTNKFLKSSVKFILDADKGMRQLSRSMGISGSMSEMMRTNLSEATFQSALLNGSMEKMIEAQKSFSDESSKGIALSASQLGFINDIAEGTGLGASFAGKMAARFMEMGMGAKTTSEFVEDTLNDAAKIGVNGVKTVELMEQNINKANTYTFQGGREAFKEMVLYTQKMKLNVDSMFQSMEKMRTLDGAIEAAANLQVLGGEMAKLADPMQLGFLARNNPEKFTEAIASMTKGMMSFNTQTGQFNSMSAVDLDRLRRMADITGISIEELQQSAQRMAKTQIIDSKLFGVTKKDRALITEMAEFNKDSGKWEIDIGGKAFDVANLTTDQVKLLQQQEKTLQQRIKESQSFDDKFANTVTLMKSSLLPLLSVVNDGLEILNNLIDTLKSPFESLKEFNSGYAKTAAVMLGAVTLLTGSAIAKSAVSLGGSLVSKGAGGITNMVKNVVSGGGTAPSTPNSGGGNIAGQMGKLSSTQILAKAKAMQSFGIAALGVGAGVGAAAFGISKMVEAFRGLTDEQANKAMWTTVAVMGGMTAGLLALGLAGKVSSPGLLIAGGAALMLGGAIGIAAYGISTMVDSMSKLNPENMSAISSAMGEMSLSMLSLANPLGIVGAASLTDTALALSSVDFKSMSEAFNNATTFLQSDVGNLQKLKEMVDLLNNAGGPDSGLNKSIDRLNEAISKGIEVKFGDKEIDLKTNITLQLDKQVLLSSMQLGKTVIKQNNATKQGKYFGN